MARLDWFSFFNYYCIINHQGILTVIITLIVKQLCKVKLPVTTLK